MPRKLFVTLKEVAAIEAAIDKEGDMEPWVGKSLRKLLEKAKEAQLPVKVTGGLTLAEAEKALAGCRKYSPFAGGNPAGLVRNLALKGVTREHLVAVGRWLDTQRWIDKADLGLILGKWEGWLARAAALDAGSGGSSYFSGPAGFED